MLSRFRPLVLRVSHALRWLPPTVARLAVGLCGVPANGAQGRADGRLPTARRQERRGCTPEGRAAGKTEPGSDHAATCSATSGWRSPGRCS